MSNKFQEWIPDISQSSNLLTDAQYEDWNDRLLGVRAGTGANAKSINMPLRQASLVTKALMDFMIGDSAYMSSLGPLSQLSDVTGLINASLTLYKHQIKVTYALGTNPTYYANSYISFINKTSTAYTDPRQLSNQDLEKITKAGLFMLFTQRTTDGYDTVIQNQTPIAGVINGEYPSQPGVLNFDVNVLGFNLGNSANPGMWDLGTATVTITDTVESIKLKY